MVLQLQFDFGYVGDGGALQIACFLVGLDTSSGAMFATMVPDSKKMDMPDVVAGTSKWVRDLGYERVCLHGDKGVLHLLLGKVAKECRPEGQDWLILRQVSPAQGHQSSGAAEKAISTVHGLARTYLAVINTKIPSFDWTTDTPMLPWTIRYAAWVVTRYNVRRDTRMTPCETLRGQKYRKDFLPLGAQVLSRKPGANVNQLLQPGVTGLWLGRDTLSDEHLIGTAAGVMRSRAVPRLQDSVRWGPEALRAMIDTPWAPHPSHPGRPRLQRPAYEEPIAVGTLPKFIETPTTKPKTVRFETRPSGSAGQSATRQRQEKQPPEKPSCPSSSSSSAESSRMDLREPLERKQTRFLFPVESEDSKQIRQKTIRSEQSVDASTGLQRRRSCCLDRSSTGKT